VERGRKRWNQPGQQNKGHRGGCVQRRSNSLVGGGGWVAESFCFFSKKMGGSREDENGPGEKVADRSYVGEEKTKGKRLGGSSTRGNGAKLLLVLDSTKLKTPKRVGRRFLCG